MQILLRYTETHYLFLITKILLRNLSHLPSTCCFSSFKAYDSKYDERRIAEDVTVKFKC